MNRSGEADVSDDRLKERINARAQLQHVAAALYENSTAALRDMRHDAHRDGPARVRERLEHDLGFYGELRLELRGPARQRAQAQLREGGLAAEIEGWLQLDHSPPQQKTEADLAIERGMMGPNAEQLGREPADPPLEGSRDPRYGLNEEERLAYDQLEAFAEAKARADQREAAEAQLHAIHDHRANLLAAEAKIPQAQAALRTEIEDTCRDPAKALGQVEAAIRRDGAAEAARRIRAGELLGAGLAKPARARLSDLFRRDARDNREARDRIATRVETLGYYEGDLGKWSAYQPASGVPVQGAKAVRAALDRDEARVLADSDLGPVAAELARARAEKPHPVRESSQLGQAAQHHLDRLPPEGRAKVVRAAQRSGNDKITAALSHLQTVQAAVRSLREGMEGPHG